MSPIKVISTTRGERELSPGSYSQVSKDPFVFIGIGEDGRSGVLELRPTDKFHITAETPGSGERKKVLVPTLEVSFTQGRSVTIFDNSAQEDVVLSWEPNWQERLAQIERQAEKKVEATARRRRFSSSCKILDRADSERSYLGYVVLAATGFVESLTVNPYNLWRDWRTGRKKEERKALVGQIFDLTLAQAGIEIVTEVKKDQEEYDADREWIFIPLPFGEIPEHARPKILEGIEWVQRYMKGCPAWSRQNGYDQIEGDPDSGFVVYIIRAKR